MAESFNSNQSNPPLGIHRYTQTNANEWAFVTIPSFARRVTIRFNGTSGLIAVAGISSDGDAVDASDNYVTIDADTLYSMPVSGGRSRGQNVIYLATTTASKVVEVVAEESPHG